MLKRLRLRPAGRWLEGCVRARHELSALACITERGSEGELRNRDQHGEPAAGNLPGGLIETVCLEVEARRHAELFVSIALKSRLEVLRFRELRRFGRNRHGHHC